MTEDRFEPFADDSSAWTLGGLSMENGTDRIALSGNVEFTRDKAGLELVGALIARLASVEKFLKSVPDLPREIPPATREAPTKMSNPFA